MHTSRWRERERERERGSGRDREQGHREHREFTNCCIAIGVGYMSENML